MKEMLQDLFPFINQTMSEAFWLKVYSLALRVVLSCVILFITIQFVKYFKRFLRKTFKKLKVDDGIGGFLTSLSGIAIYVVVVFQIAQWIGVDAASLIALLGSAGVTIGLAIQGSLANFAGGVLILLVKPFKIGDYIIEDTKMNEGTVIEIGLIYTKLVTLDNKTVILPNGVLANSSIVNVTQTPYRLIDMKFDIAYSTDIDLAKETIKNVIISDEAVLNEKPVEVAMDSWTDSSIKITGRFYVLNENFRTTRYRVLENAKKAFDEKGIEIPFPQVVVHTAKD